MKKYIVVLVVIVAVLLIIGGLGYSWSRDGFFDVKYKESNTVIKNEAGLPEEIEIFYAKYNEGDFGGIVDMYDPSSLQNNFAFKNYMTTREELVEHLRQTKSAYGKNNSYTLIRTHKALNNGTQFVYEIKAVYQNVELRSNDTIVLLVDKDTGKAAFKNYSPGRVRE